MTFLKEPPHKHGTLGRSAIVLVNLGTPDEPTRSAVRRYLKEFLSDPRVVEIPKAVWWFILNLIILPFRSGQSAKKYATIWTREGSPLRTHTAAQALGLRAALGERGHEDLTVAMAMRYGSPSLPEVLDKLKAVSQMKPQPEVHIRGDQVSNFEHIGKVLLACQRAGIAKIGFITEPPGKS